MRKASWVLQVAASIGCLGIIATMIQPSEAMAALEQASGSILALAFALMLIAVWTRAWRWQYILGCGGISIRAYPIWKLTFIGMALNLILPGSMGDVARSYYGWKSHGNKEAMLSSSVSDKLIALITLCFLGSFSAIYIELYELFALSVGVAAVISIPLLFPEIIPWKLLSRFIALVTRKQIRTDVMIDVFRMDGRAAAVTIGISLIGWLFTNLVYYYGFIAFGLDISILYVFAVMPVVNIVRILPVSISGIGAADMLMIYMFSSVGISEAGTMMASLSVTMILIILPGIIGLLYMWSPSARPVPVASMRREVAAYEH